MLHNLAVFFISNSMKNNYEAELLPNTPLAYLDKQDMEESAVYGMELFLSSMINIIITCILGVLFGRLPETVIFLLSFCTLRKYAGGYHAPNYFLCGLSFQTIYCFIMLNRLLVDVRLIYLIIGISLTLVWVYSPVEDLNKPLDSERKQLFGKKAKLVLLAEGCAFLISRLLGYEIIYKYIVYAVLFSAVLVLAGRIKNCRVEEER